MNKKILVIILVSLLGLTASNAQVTTEEFNRLLDVQTLKVMSYNMRIASPPSTSWKGTDLAAIANVINTHQPDLVALQEVDAFTVRSGKDSHQAKELAKLTGMHYFFAKAVDRSEGDYGVAILSRFPIIEGKEYRLPVSENSEGEIRGAALIIVEALGGKIVFVSTHFDHLSDKDRLLQSETFMDIIKDHGAYPVIVGADFNMQPQHKVMDVLRQELTGCVECPLTFPQLNPTQAIDYIMLNNTATNRFKLIKYHTVPEDYASDHLPLIAEFQLLN